MQAGCATGRVALARAASPRSHYEEEVAHLPCINISHYPRICTFRYNCQNN